MRNLPATPGVLLAVLVACGPGGDASSSAYRDIPLRSEVRGVQPMTGLVVWSDNETALEALGDVVQLEYHAIFYGDVVRDEGVFDWQPLDDALHAIAGRGHQAVLRIRDTYPGVEAVSVPAYLAARPDFRTRWVTVEGARTFTPDWTNAAWRQFVLDFFDAFAERYDDDARVAFLQVGFGSYGEYHLYEGPLALGDTFPSKEFQATFLQHLSTRFDDLSWSISIDAASPDHSPLSSDPDLRKLPFGLFDDSFMHEHHSEDDQEYNRASWLFFGEDRHQTSPAGGELSYASEFDQQNALNPGTGAWGDSFESMAERYHISYMIGNDQYDHHSRDRIEEAAMSTGYRFEVTAFQSNGVDSRVTVANVGVAPIYYDAYLSLDGTRATESLRSLLPGEARTYAVASPAEGRALSIVSDRLVDGQTIGVEADLR